MALMRWLLLEGEEEEEEERNIEKWFTIAKYLISTFQQKLRRSAGSW